MPPELEPEQPRFRILLLHSRYRVPGGEEVVVETESALLRQRGHAVEALVWSNKAIALDGIANKARAAVQSVWNQSACRETETAIRAFHPDVVHVHNTFPAGSPGVIAAAAGRGVPVVMTAHNYRLACLNGMLYRDGRPCERCVGREPIAGIRHKCYRGSRAASAAVAAMLAFHRARRTWNRDVAAFFAVSEHVRDVLLRSGISSDRVVVRRHALQEDPGVGRHTEDVALIVSRLSPEKGVRIGVEAWIRADPRGALKIAGDGPERSAIEALAATHPRIEVLGAVERARVLSLMRGAKILLLPSLWNEPATPPLVAVEAIATGLPILAGGDGPMGDWVRASGVGWTAAAGDVASWAATIRQAYDDESGRTSRGEEARREYLRSHSASACVGLLEEMYGKVCARQLAERAGGA